MKIIDPKDNIFVKVGTLIRENTPINIEVLRTDLGWRLVKNQGIWLGQKTIARIRTTFSEINVPGREVPDWLKRLAIELEKLVEKEVKIHLEKDNWL